MSSSSHAERIRIAQASAATGVSPRSLRYYEEQGLVKPERGHQGWRYYSEADLSRVREVRLLLDAGLPIFAIRRLVRSLIPEALPQGAKPDEDLIEQLEVLRDRLDTRIACLTRSRDALARWLTPR